MIYFAVNLPFLPSFSIRILRHDLCNIRKQATAMGIACFSIKIMHMNHFASGCRSIVCHNRTAEDPAKMEEPSGTTSYPNVTRLCTLFNPYTPQMKYFVDYLNTLSNGGRFLINSLTGISKSAASIDFHI